MNALRVPWRLLCVLARVLAGWCTIRFVFPRLAPGEREARVQAWAQDMLRALGIPLAVHGQPPVRRGMLYFTAVGQFYVYPAWTADDMGRFEAVLDGAGRAAIASWDTVRAMSIRGDVPRPCDRCGYRGRGCPGVGVPDVARPDRTPVSTPQAPTI